MGHALITHQRYEKNVPSNLFRFNGKRSYVCKAVVYYKHAKNETILAKCHWK